MSTIVNSEFLKLFEKFPMRSQEFEKDPVVVTKLFDSAGSATWYLTEYDPKSKTGFGYVTGLSYDEWGYVSIEELQTLLHPILEIPRIERDLYFQQKPISEILPKAVNTEL